jgi:holo-[acyl-carrier protein] synthase
MNVIGNGIDLLDLAEVSRLIEDPAGHFVDRCFTEAERVEAGVGVNRVERLAGRFAAKEAVVKALGVGWGGGIAWTDVEIRTRDTGAPYVVLHGRAAELAAEQSISAWLVSTSHTEMYVIASALALGAEDR